MQNMIILLLLGPFVASITLGLFSIKSRKLINFLGVFGIILSFFATLMLGKEFFLDLKYQSLTVFLWPWLSFIFADVAFLIDSLSLAMCLMITFVSSWIVIFSVQFMEDDVNIKRYFCFMNLFVGMMLILVLANNLGLLYLGWEGVGLCSYFLIGFWYDKEKNNKAALKAFITTRLGDLFLLIAIIWIGLYFETLEYKSLFNLISESSVLNKQEAFLLGLLLLIGAMGKSAQVPLHIWLPDAMVGPTPVSALIHAATMVTAGVYLIARLTDFFALSLMAQNLCLIVGLLTAFLGGIWALAQTDIKKMLAYSTVSQIGLMFSGLGVGAVWASIFHLISHAFFKALLFLAAGIIGYSIHEYNIIKLGGLRKRLPLAFYAFLLGGGALAGLPIVTCGFYSKEAILSSFYFSNYPYLLVSIGFIISAITCIYIFRSIFSIFLGDFDCEVIHKPRWPMKISITILGLCVLLLGLVKPPLHHDKDVDALLLILSSIVFVVGFLIAFFSYKNNWVAKFLKNGFYVDELYSLILINPYKKICNIFYHDVLEKFYYWLVRIIYVLSQYISFFQTGLLRRYTQMFAIALIIVLGIVVTK